MQILETILTINLTLLNLGFLCVFAPVVAWEAGKPLVMERVEVAPPQAMEMNVKVKYTSLCHIDLYFWEDKVSSNTYYIHTLKFVEL
ncbi:alcohol dehydrogenase-like [Pyrus ussuriensis x Pyrus communis]|uniref:Alcohol dehydrogenase-like n=1 Tax=Pyrus ussuriensis x Pyrus communis TaxID=2448454 RepID=A0A5N5GMZ7_9ROSA|nr:alcohol dehydrogenase-like [Pyrus ussuriensis x Pyrus communis]